MYEKDLQCVCVCRRYQTAFTDDIHVDDLQDFILTDKENIYQTNIKNNPHFVAQCHRFVMKRSRCS